MEKNKKIYLAIPYTEIKEISFRIANRVAGMLIQQGYVVFSPISHSHPIWKESVDLLENDFDTWMQQDKAFLEWADELYVIEIHGDVINNEGIGLIYRSKGVKQEIEWAKEQNKPIKLVIYNDDKDLIIVP